MVRSFARERESRTHTPPVSVSNGFGRGSRGDARRVAFPSSTTGTRRQTIDRRRGREPAFRAEGTRCVGVIVGAPGIGDEHLADCARINYLMPGFNDFSSMTGTALVITSDKDLTLNFSDRLSYRSDTYKHIGRSDTIASLNCCSIEAALSVLSFISGLMVKIL